MTIGRREVICDSTIASDLSLTLFDPVELKKAGLLYGHSVGRGDAWFIKYREYDWVLRHFRRGGLVGRFVNDRYLGWNLENTRAWAEWRLLAELYRRGLPVPRPVAASVSRGCGYYRADLLTETIAESNTFTDVLIKGEVSEEDWKNLGSCLRRFHVQGVYHADLNARNILIDTSGQIFLIDFDRGRIREKGAWQQDNLQRLKRSLLKLERENEGFEFTEVCWQLLLDSYGIERYPLEQAL